MSSTGPTMTDADPNLARFPKMWVDYVGHRPVTLEALPLANFADLDLAMTRSELRESSIRSYMDVFDLLPPVLAVRGRKQWLADGRHRVEAGNRLGRREIMAYTVPGGLDDAILIGGAANMTQTAIRYTNADKNATVVSALKDPVLAALPQALLGDLLGVGRSLVGKWKEKDPVTMAQMAHAAAMVPMINEPANAHLTNAELADRLGISTETVRRHRRAKRLRTPRMSLDEKRKLAGLLPKGPPAAAPLANPGKRIPNTDINLRDVHGEPMSTKLLRKYQKPTFARVTVGRSSVLLDAKRLRTLIHALTDAVAALEAPESSP